MRALRILLCLSLLLPTVGSVERPPTFEFWPESSGRPQSPHYQALASEGKRLAAEGRYREAAERFERGYRECVQAGRTEAATLFLVNLANSRLALHQYGEAMQRYLEARTRARAAKDEKLASLLSVNIAWLYRAQGALAEAETTLREALEGTPAAEAYALLADIRARNGDPEGAFRAFSRAVELADDAGDHATAVRVLDWFGDALLRDRRLAEAETVLLESYRRRVLSRIQVPALCYRNLALLKLAQGDLASARRLIDRAFEAARGGAGLIPLWSLYFSRARIRLAQGRFEEALADVGQATGLIQSLRLACLPADTFRTSAGAELQEVYALGVEAAARLYERTRSPAFARTAFEMAELNRAVGLRETLHQFDRIRDRLPPEYWETLKQLSDAESLQFREPGESVKGRIERLRLRLTELETKAGLADRSPGSGPAPASAERIQAALGAGEALFSFHLGAERAYLWAVTRRQFEFHRLGSAAGLAERIAEFRRAVTGSRDSETRGIGQALFSDLFGRVGRAILLQPDWLLLVEGALFELPFAALIETSAGRPPAYLIERHSVRLLPGAAMLLTPEQEAWRGPMVALGDPVYNYADQRRERRAGLLLERYFDRTPRLELARLAGSGRELERAAAAYHAADAAPILLTGPRASLGALREALARQPAVLHLATHVVPSAQDPAVGQIALSLGPAGAPEVLGVTEISVLRARPQLVVMAGCSSGAGKQLAGEGLWGLTRAWLRAGARRVAATSWPVMDSSGELEQSLYRQLGRSERGSFSRPPERALQLAQIEMIRSRGWKSRPAYWAAYFLVSRN
jgi:CHAT domain-containing protein/Tfp pilus assembly protein PilF